MFSNVLPKMHNNRPNSLDNLNSPKCVRQCPSVPLTIHAIARQKKKIFPAKRLNVRLQVLNKALVSQTNLSLPVQRLVATIPALVVAAKNTKLATVKVCNQ